MGSSVKLLQPELGGRLYGCFFTVGLFSSAVFCSNIINLLHRRVVSYGLSFNSYHLFTFQLLF